EGDADDPLAGLDEDRMAGVMGSLAAEMGGMDDSAQQDPKQLARFLARELDMQPGGAAPPTAPEPRPAGGPSTADIGVLESMGSDKYAYFDLDHQGASHADAASVGAGQFVARLSPESQATRGSRTELFYDTRKVAVFDQSSGANLRL
nr:hypothetical protein [Gordonia sp. (in: high G+C Gram-positive bacteria)]